MPEALDPDAQRQLRAVATASAYVSHKGPQSEPIPASRQAIASESFQDGKSGRYVRAGHVLRDDDPVATANRRLFRRPARPLEAA